MTNHPNRSKTRPTPNQIRKHYKDQGYEVRIDRAGHIEFRGADETMWLEGRWVSEYRFDPEVAGGVVLV